MVRKRINNRMKKEISYLERYYPENTISQSNPSDDHEVLNIYIKHNNKLLYNVIIDIYYKYPFESPGVYFYGRNNEKILYFNFFKTCSDFYLKNISYAIHSCPCCWNLVCNREVCNSLLDILKDVEFLDNQFKCIRSRYFCSKYLNLVDEMSDDMVNYIIDYI